MISFVRSCCVSSPSLSNTNRLLSRLTNSVKLMPNARTTSGGRAVGGGGGRRGRGRGSNQPTSTAVINRLPPSSPLSLLQKVKDPNNVFLTTPLPFIDLPIALLCGHGAFILTGMAYVTTDILHLRTMVAASISMQMIFQYYRHSPLRMPLRWNALFLCINAVMVTLLTLERNEANGMDDEQNRIYEEGLFEKRGFDKVKFYRLFRLAKRQEKKRGDYLKKDGIVTKELYFIENGSANITKNQILLAKLTQNDFCGESEFIDFQMSSNDLIGSKNGISTEMPTVATNKDESEFTQSHIEKNESVSDKETVDVIVDSDIIIIWVWDFDELKDFLDHDKIGVSNALQAYIGHELREKLTDSWQIKIREDKEREKLQQLAVDFLMNDLGK